MTKSPDDKSHKNLKSELGTSSASQHMRKLLNKKNADQKSGLASGRRDLSTSNMRNSFQNIAPTNSSRKTRKGLRPG